MSKHRLTLGEARRMFFYNRETGVLTRREATQGRKAGSVVGSLRKDGYIQVRIKNVAYLAHRLIWFIESGHWPIQEIDHINGVKDDNRIANLREASRSLNCQNVKTARMDSQTGIKGVRKNYNKWEAYIRVAGIRHYLGLHKTKEQAQHAYITAKNKLHKAHEVEE